MMFPFKQKGKKHLQKNYELVLRAQAHIEKNLTFATSSICGIDMNGSMQNNTTIGEKNSKNYLRIHGLLLIAHRILTSKGKHIVNEFY